MRSRARAHRWGAHSAPVELHDIARRGAHSAPVELHDRYREKISRLVRRKYAA
jgi:hypothetical protein